MTESEIITLEDGTIIEIHARIHEGIPGGYMPYKPDVVADPFNLAKHASHDQSNHGNWARGGRSVNRDIAHRTLNDGGSTTRENKAVQKGKALSVHPERSRSYPNASRLNETALTAAVHDYREDNKMLLSSRGMAVGTWLDTDTDTLWLDVITVVSTEGEADRLARAHNQIAYFDIDTGQEVRTGGTGIAKRWGERVRGWFHPRGGGSASVQDDGLGTGCLGCGDRSESAVFDPLGVAKHANHDQSSHGNWARGGSSENPVLTSDIDLAAEALGQGKHVQLGRYQQAAVLIDKLRDLVADAEAKGEKAPNYDLCKVTVANTNLFCTESKGVPRKLMPQLKGVPTPGSKADELPRDVRGEVSLNDLFREHLVNKAVGVHNETVPAYWLKATQTELNGAKVAGIAKAYREGKLADERLFVSSDGYIIDGHHRWASILGVDLADGDAGDSEHLMDVAAIEMDVLDILDEANKFAADWGIPQAGFNAGFAKRLQLLTLVRKHLGPGPHPSGTPQVSHAGSRAVGDPISPHYQQPYETPSGRGGVPENWQATHMASMPPEFRAEIEKRFAEFGIEPVPGDLVENLDTLMQRIKDEHPDLVEMGEQWYADAQARIGQHAYESGAPLDVAVGMTAAMSPNSEWGQNIAMTGEMLRQLKADDPITATAADMEWLNEKAKSPRSGDTYAGLRDRLENGETPRLSDLPDNEAAAAFQMVARRRELVSENPTPKGTYSKVQFATGTVNMAKAIAIYRGHVSINDVLGGHKVRSFYNNLADPFNERGLDHVTVDTHAASAAQLFRMPMTSKRAKRTVWTGQSGSSNQEGAYPVYADAIRTVADRHGMEPNQAQAVLWVGWQQVRHEYPGITVREDALTLASGLRQRDVYGPARNSTVGRYGVQVGDSAADTPPRYKSQVSAWQQYRDGIISWDEYAGYLERTPS